MKMDDRFFSVEKTQFKTSQGEIDLPILYYDYSYVVLQYFTKYKLAEAKLAGTGYKPCRFFNGRAISMLIFFEYRDTAIGPYNEAGLAVMAYPEKKKSPFFCLPQFLRRPESWTIGAYVVDLPVTTKIAHAAGREVWNFPKFVTEIPLTLTKKRFEGAVNDPDTGKPLLSVSANIGPLGLLRINNFSFIGYTNKEGVLLRTQVDVEDRLKINKCFTSRLRVHDSSHGMARNLIDLGLKDKQTDYIMSSHKAKCRLNDGVPV